MKKIFITLLVAVVFGFAVAPGVQASVIDFSRPAVSYLGQPTSGTSSSIDNGLTLNGNIWTAYSFDTPFTVQKDSVLRFNYRSDNIPEIAAIGFDSDNSFQYKSDAANMVKFGGTQGHNWPEHIASSYYEEGSGIASYEIRLTDFLKEGDSFKYLVVINDDDGKASEGGDGNSHSIYTNVSVSATPIPGAVWILGSGLIGLLGLRKKFSK